MAAKDPWPLIHAEREALIADLAGLDSSQWTTPSLCTGWSVRDVLGHMTATARMTPARFFTSLAAAGFNFDAMTAKDVKRETAGTPADGLAAFRSLAGASTKPPGPAEAFLGEAVIHGEDIRRPLGIQRDYPPDAVARVVRFYAQSNMLLGGKRRVEGLRLHPTDADWSIGDGPEVTGPGISLALAIAGRSAGLQDLSGDGVTTLASRMPAGRTGG
jgi:uncharacterized protein (TIGR03083 family)